MKRLSKVLALIAITSGPASMRAATCSPTLFIEAATYPTGAGAARTLATGDFDGNGLPDVAVASDNSRVLSVLLNDGNGGLGAPILTALNDDPRAIAAADLRGNGTTDVILASYSGIYVLLGHNDGTFDAPVFYEADVSNILSMVVGKFDGNDTWDVALGGYYSGGIALLPGNGNGTFGAALHTAPTSQVRSMATADFNSDGHLDLAASTPTAVGVFLGNGDGTFAPPAYFIAGADLSGIASGDFDGNGHADLAVGSGTYVSILIGDGAGGFEAALQYPARINPVGALRVGDLDQNGVADIVVGEQLDFNGPGDEVAVLRGIGDGSFASGEGYATAGSGGVSLMDIDDDGLPDVVATGGAVVSVLRDTPDANLLAVPNSRLDGPGSSSVASGDFDGDGYFDFAWIYANEVLVIQGGPGGRFTEGFPLDMGAFIGAQPGAVAAITFAGDDRASLVVTTYSDVLLFRSNALGGFDEPVSIFNSFSLTQIAVGDFDGIGGYDVVVAQGCCGSANLVTLLGNGDGTFQPGVQTPLDADVYRIVAVDFTGGAPPPGGPAFTDDLIVVTNGSVRVMLSQPGGTFATSAEIPSSPYVQASVASGRFSGAADLLVGGDQPNVRLYPGNGNGTFQAPITIALPSSASSLIVGRFDEGTEDDFAALTQQGILVFLGLGDGHFQAPIALNTGVAANLIVTTDFANSGADGIAAIGNEGVAAFRNSRASALVAVRSAIVGSPAALHAHASGYGPLAYEWRKDGTPVSNGGAISGATTDTLTIDPVSFADSGSYDVVVTDACGSVTSNAASLSVEFADVPVSSPFHDDIVTIATAGITGGCGGGNYCPTSPVRRDQMAVFLLKSEHGSSYTPPACAGVFADVPCPSPFADWVEQLAAEGVTGGCGGGNYCPAGSVTRAQMAVFLLKTSQGSSYTPPAATGIFGDVPVGSFAADFIEDLYNRGITGGCQASPLLYCPSNAVLRQQMATFLVRTFP